MDVNRFVTSGGRLENDDGGISSGCLSLTAVAGGESRISLMVLTMFPKGVSGVCSVPWLVTELLVGIGSGTMAFEFEVGVRSAIIGKAGLMVDDRTDHD